MFEKFSKPKTPAEILQEQHAKKNKKSSAQGMTRRDFLGLAGKTAAVAIGGIALGELAKKVAGKKSEKFIETFLQNREKSGKLNQEQTEKNEENKLSEKENPEEIFEPEEIEMEDDDREMVESIFHPSINEDVKITPELISAVTLYWIKEYQGRRKSELDRAVSQMDKLEPFLSECFTKNNMPERLRFLAIPESGWDMEAKSRSGAIGPYQFMPNTAAEMKLKNPKDPLQSADACARLLKRLFLQSGDMNLALAGYNGIAGYYISVCKRIEKKPIYHSEDKKEQDYDYLSFLENRINNKRREIRDPRKKIFNYKVREIEVKNKLGEKIRRPETLEEIARRYKIDLAALIEKNFSPKEKKSKKLSKIKKIEKQIGLTVGQNLKINFNKENRQIKFQEEARGIIENINYPPKFNAVMYCLGIEKSKYVKEWEKRRVEGKSNPEIAAKKI